MFDAAFKVTATFLITGLFLVSSLTRAESDTGGWVSSGGELLKDARNPWFLRNTQQIKYCIEHSADDFSVSIEDTSSAVVRAIEFWKREFAQLPSEANMIGVGVQDFVFILDCSLADIRFQFGHQTLSEVQKKYIQRPQDFVGLAVRTAYDPLHLKGQGFIFINSDIGPHRYVLETEHQKTWSLPHVLDLILIHELGHIFGLPHVASSWSIMSEGFPEMLVSSPIAVTSGWLVGELVSPQEKFRFFIPHSEFFDCLYSLEKASREWFGVQPLEKQTCIQVETRGSALAPTHAEVFAIEMDGSSGDPTKNKIADILFNSQSWELVDIFKNLHIFVHLTKEQNIFDVSEAFGPPRMTYSNQGTYVPLHDPSDRRPIVLRIGALEDFELLGVHHGNIIRLLKFVP